MNQRFHSLDVFRGATVCLMILVNNPGSWAHIFSPLEHAKWHGITPTDLVFPFFLFAVGNAMAFVLPKLEVAGAAAFWKKITKRSLLIFLIGLFLSWYPFVSWQNDVLAFRHWVNPENPESGVRILGVLQRIAICYFFASVIVYYLKARGAFFAGCVLLLVYWFLCYAGNPADPYSLNGWFGTAIDKKILGVAHMYKGEGLPFDPEGLMSTLPAIVQVIFGYLVGDYIRNKPKAYIAGNNLSNNITAAASLYPMITGLSVTAVALLIGAYCWDLVFPINKKIWTSSYVLCTTGLAVAIIASMIYAIELRGVKNWLTRFFDVFGKNALFVFALSAFLPKTLNLIRLGNDVTPWNWLYKKVWINVLPSVPELGSLLYALTVISFMWLICWWMDKKGIYVKV
ncbi:MAG: DUF1624 domain-containing protein [Chitinophagaceae bacterium]|nr:DUF1624 domain-containing protein [Chitinophagaceae bacterium]